jgi:hypothetical protein
MQFLFNFALDCTIREVQGIQDRSQQHVTHLLLICADDISLLAEKHIQWNLNLSFLKGMENRNDECGKTINPENYIHYIKKILFNRKVIHCPLLLGGILPQLKIQLFET